MTSLTFASEITPIIAAVIGGVVWIISKLSQTSQRHEEALDAATRTTANQVESLRNHIDVRFDSLEAADRALDRRVSRIEGRLTMPPDGPMP